MRPGFAWVGGDGKTIGARCYVGAQWRGETAPRQMGWSGWTARMYANGEPFLLGITEAFARALVEDRILREDQENAEQQYRSMGRLGFELVHADGRRCYIGERMGGEHPVGDTFFEGRTLGEAMPFYPRSIENCRVEFMKTCPHGWRIERLF